MLRPKATDKLGWREYYTAHNLYYNAKYFEVEKHLKVSYLIAPVDPVIRSRTYKCWINSSWPNEGSISSDCPLENKYLHKSHNVKKYSICFKIITEFAQSQTSLSFTPFVKCIEFNNIRIICNLSNVLGEYKKAKSLWATEKNSYPFSTTEK